MSKLGSRYSVLGSRLSVLGTRQIMDDLIPICFPEENVFIGSTRCSVLGTRCMMEYWISCILDNIPPLFSREGARWRVFSKTKRTYNVTNFSSLYGGLRGSVGL